MGRNMMTLRPPKERDKKNPVCELLCGEEVKGLGCRVYGLGFWGLGPFRAFSVWDLKFRAGFKVLK